MMRLKTKPGEMSNLKKIHWIAPTSMVTALLTGFGLALAHHFFYNSLESKTVPTASYDFVGRSLSGQQLNTAVGTALAFLVRTFLAISVSSAYVQILWRSMRNAKENPSLQELNWAHCAASDIFNMLNLKLGWKYPLLALMAVIFWGIPIATLFPPATLSVENKLVTNTTSLQVPQFDFTSFDYVSGLEQVGLPDPQHWAWPGPSQEVQTIASAVMALGQTLQIVPPASNTSWTIDFWGPALQCNDVLGAEREKIWTSITDSQINVPTDRSRSLYVFMSWVPWSDLDLAPVYNISTYASSGYAANGYTISSLNIDRDLPFLINAAPEAAIVGPPPSDLSTGGPASIFFAAMPQIYYNNPSNPTFENATLLRCDLVNTSYSVDFDYSNGAQNIQVSRNMTGTSPIVNASYYFAGPDAPPYGTMPTSVNCTTFIAATMDWVDPNCLFDAGAVRLLSYQGIMAAFNRLVRGYIAVEGTGIAPLAITTEIMSTSLVETDEVAFIRPLTTNAKFQSVISSYSWWKYPGLMNPKLPSSRGDLRSNIEQLFQNFTISLLSEPYLQPGMSPFAPPRLTSVTQITSQNIYSYDSETLWIAYGLSILFALAAVILGLVTMVLNEESFSNSFSTIFRISRTAELSVQIRKNDGSGSDPLPPYLKHARVGLGAGTAARLKLNVAEDEADGGQRLAVASANVVHRSGTVKTI